MDRGHQVTLRIVTGTQNVSDLSHGCVRGIGRQQHGAQTDETVQHMVPLLERQADALALGGVEVMIDIDDERACACCPADALAV